MIVKRIFCSLFSSNVFPTPFGPRSKHIFTLVHSFYLMEITLGELKERFKRDLRHQKTTPGGCHVGIWELHDGKGMTRKMMNYQYFTSYNTFFTVYKWKQIYYMTIPQAQCCAYNSDKLINQDSINWYKSVSRRGASWAILRNDVIINQVAKLLIFCKLCANIINKVIALDMRSPLVGRGNPTIEPDYPRKIVTHYVLYFFVFYPLIDVDGYDKKNK